MSSKPLGELLIEARLINSKQLNYVLQLQTLTKEKPGQILIRLGYITTNTLVEFLSKQHGTQAIDPYTDVIDEEAVSVIAGNVATKYKAVPINFKSEGREKKLAVAMADPSNLETIDTISFMIGYRIKPVFVMEESIGGLINYCYHKRLEIK
ncbi:MAG TPA: hypothetical protein VHT73_09485 [Thermodesulfobacteriota bacterium]|nr:hypothetical protein [Thermodesulfobacteriota bacterium]